MKKEQNSVQEDLAIDANRLEEEWLDQPSRFWKYSEQAAQARTRWEAAKRHTKTLRATIESQIRQNPEAFCLTKVTEAAISAALEQHKYILEAVEDEEAARYEMDMLYVAKDAMEQRRDALNNLVRLHGQNYFAKPFVPSSEQGGSGQWDEQIAKKADEKVQRSLKKKIKVRK